MIDLEELRAHDLTGAKAADEIERLRAKTKADAEAWHEQEEKIERLRAALDEIANKATSPVLVTSNDIVEIARKALTAAQ